MALFSPWKFYRDPFVQEASMSSGWEKQITHSIKRSSEDGEITLRKRVGTSGSGQRSLFHEIKWEKRTGWQRGQKVTVSGGPESLGGKLSAEQEEEMVLKFYEQATNESQRLWNKFTGKSKFWNRVAKALREHPEFPE